MSGWHGASQRTAGAQILVARRRHHGAQVDAVVLRVALVEGPLLVECQAVRGARAHEARRRHHGAEVDAVALRVALVVGLAAQGQEVLGALQHHVY